MSETLKVPVIRKKRVIEPAQSEGPMDFSGALLALKRGERVTRTGWNGKGMFLYLVPGSEFHVSRPPLLGIYPTGKHIRYRPHIDMVCADGACAVWTAAQSDILESDWIVVDVDGSLRKSAD